MDQKPLPQSLPAGNSVPPNSIQKEDTSKEEVETFPLAEDDDLLIALASDIIDKQYRLYSWADSKTLSLITTDSILLATIGFLFKECYSDTFSMISILISFFLIGVSLYYSLMQVVPQASSGKSKGSSENLRALSGITSFSKWQEYHVELLKINKRTVHEICSRQIFGMAINVDKSRKTTKKGVKFTMAGIIFLFLSVAGISSSSKRINIIGNWQEIKKDTVVVFKHDTIITYKQDILFNKERK